jgi:large subunit ribosomal protein L4
MARAEVRDVQGNVVEERELPEALFGAPVNVPLMHQVVVAGMAAQRAGTHSTKTRAEVTGGGKKPWRQKGTGRARQGSIRAPQWMGGGIAHGPKPRSYEMRVNRKMKKVALRSALSDAAQNGKVVLVSGLSFDGPRTKDAVGVLDAFGVQGAVLLVIGAPDEALEKSFRNLPQVKIDYPGNLSTYDVLYADRILLATEALAVLSGEEPAESAEATVAPEAATVAEASEPKAVANAKPQVDPKPEAKEPKASKPKASRKASAPAADDAGDVPAEPQEGQNESEAGQ